MSENNVGEVSMLVVALRGVVLMVLVAFNKQGLQWRCIEQGWQRGEITPSAQQVVC